MVLKILLIQALAQWHLRSVPIAPPLQYLTHRVNTLNAEKDNLSLHSDLPCTPVQMLQRVLLTLAPAESNRLSPTRFLGATLRKLR